jgi:hypothetical protein
MKINFSLFSILFFVILFTGCDKFKQPPSDDELNAATCANMSQLTIHSNSPVTIGEAIHLAAPEVGGYRIYRWQGPNNFDDQYPETGVTYAELKNEGWYYLSVSNNSCGAKYDSVYVDVKLQQGSPSCTITGNSTSYTTLGNDNYSNTQKHVDASTGYLALEATGGSGFANMVIYFHPRWLTAEPEDGIYNSTNVAIFGQTDYNYNTVFVSTTKNSIYWACHEGQQVYVSHAAGKLQVRFCDLQMSGSNGTSYTTKASGNIIER